FVPVIIPVAKQFAIVPPPLPPDMPPAPLTEYQNVINKISDRNLHNALQEMQVRYDVQQKELEIVQQQAEIERQTTIRNYSFMGLGVVIIVAGLMAIILVQRNKRNAVLSETNATKDKFFSIISHDLKNPAFAQRDGLKTLMDYASKTDKIDAYTLSNSLSKLYKSVNGMIELLKNLLNWAQLQTGRTTYRPVRFNLMEAIQSDMGVIKSMAERKNITFDAQTPQTALITADENMLATVVRNLLANAVKFTEEDGKVSLEITERGDKFIVSVSDTGIGMTHEQLQNLFRIDRQQSTHDTTGEQGTGLGLIVCKEFLEKHDSRLHVESREGVGSRFWFEVG
ncbi:MAG: HAMP domain-containing histidine kinase, partial [Bacteroidales bacterium]|nr:HAMP domain-containing histidine kinase [Bacteroidales bacterium]